MKSFTTNRRSRLTGLAASTLALGLVASACGGGGGGSNDKSPGTNPEGKTIVMASIGWNENVAVNALWTQLLEKRGYKVKTTTLGATQIYQGLAQDSLDLFFDAWLPKTHEAKMKDYGDSLEKIGPWYDNATLEWTVPAYLKKIDSIKDLQGKAEMFNGKITGIDPTAGITTVSKNKVIPMYNLKDYKLQVSSTGAMLGALKRAIATKEPIVVTLWHPHIAYAKYDLKDLKDPKGALGTGEKIVAIAREGFNEDTPKVAKWIEKFQLTKQQLRSLEDLMFNKYPENHAKAAKQWISKHQDLVSKWVPKAQS